MQEIGLPQVMAGIQKAFAEGELRRADALLGPALDQFPDIPQLWFFAGILDFKVGSVAKAALQFEKCLALDESAFVMANLGACYRRMNRMEEGKHILRASLERAPDYAPALTNMGCMFVNEGTPHEGIPYLLKAEQIGGEPGATWNLGLLYLEAGNFAEGFDRYAKGIGAERMVRNYGSDKHGLPEPKILDITDPRAGKTLIVWGEQGIGDELMFSTIIEDARQEFGEVIFECHPRLAKLHAAAHPDLRILPTRKDEHITWPLEQQVRADYKCPIGDLARLYRRDRDSFTASWKEHGPMFSADETEVADYRTRLRQMAGARPIVGLATRGGVIQTARTYRTIRPSEIEYLFKNTDCLFVGLDYDDMSDFHAFIGERYGHDRYMWWPSVVQHWDYDHTAALVAACDLTVTVCQSVAHLAAYMGAPTRVLTPKRAAWRYGLEDEEWYWAPDPNVRLYRAPGEEWGPALDRAIADIAQLPRVSA